MTKKDYKVLADILKKVKNEKLSNGQVMWDPKVIERIVVALQIALVQDNPRFDASKFEEAVNN